MIREHLPKDVIPEITVSFWTLENMVDFLDHFFTIVGNDSPYSASSYSETALRKMGFLGSEKYSKRKKLFSKPATQWKMEDLNPFFNRFFDIKEYKCDYDPKLVKITGEQYCQKRSSEVTFGGRKLTCKLVVNIFVVIVPFLVVSWV